MTRALRRPGRLGIILACAVVAVGGATGFGRSDLAAEDAQTVRALPRPEAPLIAEAPSGALTARPLFDPSRRPETPAETPIPVPAAPPPVTLSLSGIVGDTATGFTAIFRMSNVAGLRMVRAGDRIDRWVVVDVTGRSVRLQDDSGTMEVLDLR